MGKLSYNTNINQTGIAPLHLKGQVDSGKLAGVLNGFCYLGSTISSYGLELVADQWGWRRYSYFFWVSASPSPLSTAVTC